MLGHVSVPILVHQPEQPLRPALLAHELLEGESAVQVLVLVLEHSLHLVTATRHESVEFLNLDMDTHEVLLTPASASTRVHWSLLSFPSASRLTAFWKNFRNSSFFFFSSVFLFIKNQLILKDKSYTQQL